MDHASVPRARPTLAVQLKPEQGESLSSWLQNCAYLADVSVADLFEYLDLPRVWADGNLARGVCHKGRRHSPDDTNTLLTCLSEALEYPIDRLRRLLVHASPHRLRSPARPFGCSHCAAEDTQQQLLPRIKRHWLLRCCRHCDRHGTRLQFLDHRHRGNQGKAGKRPSATRTSVSFRYHSPEERDFIDQIHQGLLLGWEPEHCPPSAILFQRFQKLTAAMPNTPHRSSLQIANDLATDCLRHGMNILWFVQKDRIGDPQRAELIFSLNQLCQIVENTDLNGGCFVVSRSTYEESFTIPTVVSLHLQRVRERLGSVSARLEETNLRLGSFSSRLEETNQRLRSASSRLEEANQRNRAALALEKRRALLHAEIAREQAALGNDLVGNVSALRQRARDFLDAAGLHELYPLFPADMERLARICLSRRPPL